MKLHAAAPLAVLAGALGGFFWRWQPVAGPDEIARQRAQQIVSLGTTPPGDAAERFLAALQQKGDPMRLEHDLWLAVQSLAVEDFGIFTGDWAGVQALIKRLEGIPHDTKNAVIFALIERWLALDPDGAMRGLATVWKQVRGKIQTSEVVALLAKKNPRGLVNLILAEPDETERANLAHSALISWESGDWTLAESLIASCSAINQDRLKQARDYSRAKLDPEFGMSRVGSIADVWQRREILHAVGDALAKRGGGAVADAIEQHPEWDTEERSAVLLFLADSNPAAAAELVARPPVRQWSNRVIARIAGELSSRESGRARAWVESLTGEARALAENRALERLGARDPEGALEWFGKNPPVPDSYLPRWRDPRASVFADWMMRDPDAARGWFAAVPPGPLREQAASGFLRDRLWAEDIDEAASFFTAHQPRLPESAQEIAIKLSGNNPRRAAEWAASLAPGDSQNAALRTTAEAMARDDAATAAEWIGGFPPGLARDSAIRGFVGVASERDPDAAREWVTQIEDRYQRTRAATTLFLAWKTKDAPAAKQWLQSVPGIYEVVRNQTLRNE